MVKKGTIRVVPSFLIESAVYSVPNERFFRASTWFGHVEQVLAVVYHGTTTKDCVATVPWLEVNDIKYLFHSTQPWSYRDINAFADQAWRYLGLPLS